MTQTRLLAGLVLFFGIISVKGQANPTLARLPRCMSSVEVTADYARIFNISLSPNGNVLAVGSDTDLYLYDAHSFSPINQFSSDDPEIILGTFAIDWSPDGDQIAGYRVSNIGEGDTVIHIWNVSSGEIVTMIRYSDDYMFYGYDLDWSPDGNYIAVVGSFRNRIWDVSSGEVVFEPPAIVSMDDLPPMTSPQGVRVEPVLQRQPEPDRQGCCADADDCTPAAIVQ